jgi:formylglycine-generating enzyme required for sulfatase activity
MKRISILIICFVISLMIVGCGKRAKVQPLEETITNFLGMKFVLISPGTFMMGSPANEKDRDIDEVHHQVTLTKGFYLQTTEVTQEQWRRLMGSNPSHFKDCGGDCPVEMVSWDDAQEFIKKLNKIGKTYKYRLPTEAEWEYACRAGSTTAFANGDEKDLTTIGWYRSNSGEKPHRVAQKDPNAWGLYDMHGNVWEWCQDWFGDAQAESVTDPVGPTSGSKRVVRGGSWGEDARFCRSAFRFNKTPTVRWDVVGFRVIKML